MNNIGKSINIFNTLKQISNKHIINSFTNRSLTTININGYKEKIYERSDYPVKKCSEILNKDIVSVIGYGPQGRGQALNLRDNDINVCVGVRKGNSWKNAVDDGWEPMVNLFEIDEACDRGSIISYLLSDAGQINQWDNIKPYLTENKALYFSHGFGITFSDKTNIIPPDNIDVIMVCPKGSGLTVRSHFLEGRGINSSYAIHNDYTGRSKERAMAMAFGIGSGHVFETTFEKEVYSDLVGERCVLMGLVQGAFAAQYNVLRKRGHSPSEAYNETVEEALDSLYPLINQQGMDWLYKNCSTTAQRGALDWAPIFERELTPVIDYCYQEVVNGNQAQKVINANSNPEYREKLNNELEKMSSSELWTVAKELRKLRPNNNKIEKDNWTGFLL